MFIQGDSLLSSLQLKLISAHQGEIQYARALLMKVFGSGENDIGQNPISHTLVSGWQAGVCLFLCIILVQMDLVW